MRAKPRRMRELMAQRSETTRSLGEKVGCSHQMIHYLVSGQKPCSEPLACNISHALGVPVAELFNYPRVFSARNPQRRQEEGRGVPHDPAGLLQRRPAGTAVVAGQRRGTNGSGR